MGPDGSFVIRPAVHETAASKRSSSRRPQTSSSTRKRAWEAVHDLTWFAFEPSDALTLLVQIAEELDGDAAALNLLGAGPLEDLLCGDPATMERALEEARASRSFRVAVASVAGVKHGEPGYERPRDAVAHELRGDELERSPPAR